MGYILPFSILFLSAILTAQPKQLEEMPMVASLGMQTLNAGGSNIRGSGGSITYSIGDVLYAAMSGSGVSLSNGMQQAKEYMPTDRHPEILVSIYPNPMVDYFFLKIKDFENKNLIYRLFDMQGKLLNSGLVHRETTKIVPPPLKTGFYFLNILEGTVFNKTIKIVRD